MKKGKAHRKETARDPRQYYDNLAGVERPEGRVRWPPFTTSGWSGPLVGVRCRSVRL